MCGVSSNLISGLWRAFATDDGKPPTQGQFENSSLDQDSSSLSSSGALNTSFSSESNDSPQLKGQPEQNSSSVEATNPTTQSKRDLTSEIKKAAKNVQVVPPDDSPQSLTQETNSLHSKQLPQTMASGAFLSNGYPSPPGRSSSAPSPNMPMSKLNPHSTEFIPRPNSSSLNASAAVFVPRFGAVAAPSDETDIGEQQGNSETLTASEILGAFEKKSKETSGLLTMAANMLLDATSFPATFDTHLEIISELVLGKEVPDDVQDDLAELLLTWVRESEKLDHVTLLSLSLLVLCSVSGHQQLGTAVHLCENVRLLLQAAYQRCLSYQVVQQVSWSSGL